MRTPISNIKRITILNAQLPPLALIACLYGALALGGTSAHAATFEAGNIGGTWAASGNPYIVTDNCTLTSNLIIQPGVVLNIGSNLTITANGFVIQAVGTPTSRITIQPAVSSQSWNTISVTVGSVAQAATNFFEYCDFTSAQTAISLLVFAPGAGLNRSMFAEIVNCTFTNCSAQAIYAESVGAPPFQGGDSFLFPGVRNCAFNSTSNGCLMLIHGGQGAGHASPAFYANIFQNLTGAALRMSANGNAASSHATFINNTLVNCRVGVSAVDPWDAQVEANAFVGATNALIVSGSLSRNVEYNDFYANATNFTGYPGTYGSVVTVNGNGTPSDILYNIFQNPLFVSATDVHLGGGSPCIDAGPPDAANYDSCLPPSLGSLTNDIGAYGGPNDCQWIATAPLTNIFNLAIAKYVGVTVNPPASGHYRLEYAPAVGNTNNWTQITNLILSAPFTYYDPVGVGPRFYRAVLLP